MQNKCSMRLWKAVWMLAAVTSSNVVTPTLAANPSGAPIRHFSSLCMVTSVDGVHCLFVCNCKIAYPEQPN